MAGNFGSLTLCISAFHPCTQKVRNSLEAVAACADGLGRPQWSVSVPSPAVIIKHSGESIPRHFSNRNISKTLAMGRADVLGKDDNDVVIRESVQPESCSTLLTLAKSPQSELHYVKRRKAH